MLLKVQKLVLNMILSNLNEIVSLTTVQNMRSRRIMEKIGMHHDPKDDFDHPKLSEGHALRRHVLYRINQQEWRQHTSKESYGATR